MIWTAVAAAAMLLWLTVLSLPWRPWRTGEALDADAPAPDTDLADITALIPARNEAATIAPTLRALAAQGRALKIVLVDDQSGDDTAAVARATGIEHLSVVTGAPLPAGWTGKLWALEQGRAHATTRLILLLDADIALAPGTLSALRRRIDKAGFQLASLMAAPPVDGLAERLLMPAFIYFFKLLYPFRLSNSRHPMVAAAAGGCVLLEREVLEEIDGFSRIRAEIIDDCALARQVKSAGHRTWIGLTHSARMLRHHGLRDIWDMVARTAYTQLHYSVTLLLLCTALIGLAFWVPAAALALAGAHGKFLAAAALAGMMVTYVPVLRFYGLSPLWGLTLPLTGTLYVAMTWTSAVRYGAGQRSRWKDRTYSRTPDHGT